MSLSMPAQCHINEKFLKEILAQLGPVKPLRRFDISNWNGEYKNSAYQTNINYALNNWHDIEYAKCLMIAPKMAEQLVNDPYFNSIGHSYNITWSSVLGLIAATEDPQFKFIPDPHTWEDQVRQLRESKHEYFHTGERLSLSAIGAREIFEGQARFSQIQFLYEATNKTFDLEAAKESRMFGRVYVAAFEAFIDGLGEPWPNSPIDPIVNLFLLVCDLAMNPGDGFPFDIIHPPSFFESLDLGMRFTMLCWMIRDKHPKLKHAITKCSREEYLGASELLSQTIACPSPRHIWEEVNRWSEEQPTCKSLLRQSAVMQFDMANLPIKLFFSEFLKFQKSKSEHPEYFCWPGYWSVQTDGKNAEFTEDLFKAHEPLFIDSIEGEVRPRIPDNKPEESTQATFNAFYQWNAYYLLNRQWLVSSGPFELDFDWLTVRHDTETRREWASKIFSDAYGVEPKDFRIIS
jgi:hypothetical protein